MTRFFFHVREGDGGLSLDSEGEELAGLEAARREAIASVREMLGERLLHGGELDHRQIEIANEKGEVLAVVVARDVLLEKDQFRLFSDDVTKSAPSARPSETGAKSPAE
jgi:hypothetical protein